MSKFSEKVFNKIDNAKIDELKEIRFKVECIGDVADILKEIIKYSGNDKQLRDYNDIVYVASEIVYDNENKRIYIDFEDEEDIK